MARKTSASSFPSYGWLAEAGWVFMAHSVQLWTDPVGSNARLAGLWAEKVEAFTEGVWAANGAVLRGAAPDTIAEAALAPTRRRVRANARKLRSP